MPLLNYTTSVPVVRTLSQVQALLVMAVVVAPPVALAVAGELWDWARPHLTAAGLRVAVWLGEVRRG